MENLQILNPKTNQQKSGNSNQPNKGITYIKFIVTLILIFNIFMILWLKYELKSSEVIQHYNLQKSNAWLNKTVNQQDQRMIESNNNMRTLQEKYRKIIQKMKYISDEAEEIGSLKSQVQFYFAKIDSIRSQIVQVKASTKKEVKESKNQMKTMKKEFEQIQVKQEARQKGMIVFKQTLSNIEQLMQQYQTSFFGVKQNIITLTQQYQKSKQIKQKEKPIDQFIELEKKIKQIQVQIKKINMESKLQKEKTLEKSYQIQKQKKGKNNKDEQQKKEEEIKPEISELSDRIDELEKSRDHFKKQLKTYKSQINSSGKSKENKKISSQPNINMLQDKANSLISNFYMNYISQPLKIDQLIYQIKTVKGKEISLNQNKKILDSASLSKLNYLPLINNEEFRQQINDNISPLLSQNKNYLQKTYKIDSQQIGMCVLSINRGNSDLQEVVSIQSIVNQNYDSLKIVFLKNSKESSQLVKQYHRKLISNQKLSFFTNDEQKSQKQNIEQAITDECQQNEIIVLLDSRDELIGNSVLKLLNAVYNKKEVDVLYSNHIYLQVQTGKIVPERSTLVYNQKDIDQSKLAHLEFNRYRPNYHFGRMISFKKEAFEKANYEDGFIDQNQDIPCTKFYYVDEITHATHGPSLSTRIQQSLQKKDEILSKIFDPSICKKKKKKIVVEQDDQ